MKYYSSQNYFSSPLYQFMMPTEQEEHDLSNNLVKMKIVMKIHKRTKNDYES